MTHCELVTVLEEFHPHETHFFSLFLNMAPHHKKCLHGSLLLVHVGTNAAALDARLFGPSEGNPTG
jgi:hypothetical protein